MGTLWAPSWRRSSIPRSPRSKFFKRRLPPFSFSPCVPLNELEFNLSICANTTFPNATQQRQTAIPARQQYRGGQKARKESGDNWCSGSPARWKWKWKWQVAGSSRICAAPIDTRYCICRRSCKCARHATICHWIPLLHAFNSSKLVSHVHWIENCLIVSVYWISKGLTCLGIGRCLDNVWGILGNTILLNKTHPTSF